VLECCVGSGIGSVGGGETPRLVTGISDLSAPTPTHIREMNTQALSSALVATSALAGNGGQATIADPAGIQRAV
jgi:hypothetical protein